MELKKKMKKGGGGCVCAVSCQKHLWNSPKPNIIHVLFIIFQAYQVLGQYFVLNKDEDKFKKWLKDICAANDLQQNECFLCLKEWCDQFFS